MFLLIFILLFIIIYLLNSSNFIHEKIDYNYNNELLIINNFFSKNDFKEIKNICKKKNLKMILELHQERPFVYSKKIIINYMI